METFEFDGGLVRFTLAGRVLAQLVTWIWNALLIGFLLLVAFVVGAAIAGAVIYKVI